MNTWLIGAGVMSQEYCKVLSALKEPFEVIGRGLEKSRNFESVTGFKVQSGGLQKALSDFSAPNSAIVAVGVESLANVTMQLIKAGTKRILVEKPGGINIDQIRSINELASKHRAVVLIAYNRRFYESTIRARNLIEQDGGAISCNFEFTEWSHVIAPSVRADGIKESWFLANSTHVVDLAFNLCGFPKDWKSWHGGRLDWHPASARFCGAGITDKNVFFSYHADWEAPGRWGVEVLTRKHKLILQPMEQLYAVNLGSVKIESVEINNTLDKLYKPGLFLQLKAFLDCNDHLFCSIGEQLRNSSVYNKIAGYTNQENFKVK